MPLVTAAQVRDAGIPALSGTGRDSDLIEPLIARATAALAQWCGYPMPSTGARATLESATYVLCLTGLREDRRRLLLPFDGGRVTAITSIYDDPDRDWTSDTLVASSDYTLRSREGEVFLSSSSVQGAWTYDPEGAVKVTMTAGWTATGGANPVDLPVEQAILMLVQHWARLRTEAGRTSVGASGVSVGTRDETIPESVQQLMSPYKLWTWGPL